VVNGLAPSDVGDLLRAGGRDVDLAPELHSATGGNAFFLTELIRHGNGAPLGEELPDSIRAMVGVRLDRLDRTVTHVLNLTAVAGPAATLSVLELASGLDGDRLWTPPTPRSRPGCSSRTAPDAWRCRTP
jgi:hypothetical protein